MSPSVKAWELERNRDRVYNKEDREDEEYESGNREPCDH